MSTHHHHNPLQHLIIQTKNQPKINGKSNQNQPKPINRKPKIKPNKKPKPCTNSLEALSSHKYSNAFMCECMWVWDERAKRELNGESAKGGERNVSK